MDTETGRDMIHSFHSRFPAVERGAERWAKVWSFRLTPCCGTPTWYTGLGLAGDAAQISHGIQDGSWVDGTLGGVGGSLDMLGMVIDPLGSLAAWGVSWLMEHVRPLTEALDRLAGNPDEIAAHAATWRNVAAAAAASRQHYTDLVRAQTGGWVGASGDAYRGHAAQRADALGGVAKASEGIAYAVEGRCQQ